MQHAELTHHMQDESASTLTHATRVNEIADSLRDNAAADHQNALRFPWATYVQAMPVDVCCTMLVIEIICVTKAYGCESNATYMRWGQYGADDLQY